MGIKTTAQLRCLRPILSEWIAINRRLGKTWAVYRDAPWWSNERAFLSVFSGAVWQSCGYAFEEFSETKRRKKRSYPGRVDLWFSTGQQEFLAEAKNCWLAATARRDQTNKVREFMEQAKADVRRCHPDGMRRLAIVFGSPYVARRRESEIENRIEWLIEQAVEIKAEIEAHAVAWTFPQLRRYPTSEGWVYPGVIVWIKEVKR